MGVKDIVGKEELKDLGWDQTGPPLYPPALVAVLNVMICITFILAIYFFGSSEEANPIMKTFFVVLLLASFIFYIYSLAVHAYIERYLYPVTKRSIRRTYELDLDTLTRGMVDLLRRSDRSILTLTEDKIIQSPYHPWKFLPDEIIAIEGTDVHILLNEFRGDGDELRTGALIGPVGQDTYDVVLRLVRSFQVLG